MRRFSIQSVLASLLLLALSACSAAPAAAPVSTAVEATSAAPGVTASPTPAAPEAYPPAAPDPTVSEPADAYPEPQAAAPTEAPAYPAPQAGSPASVPAPSAFPDPSAYTWKAIVNGIERPVDLSGDRMGRLLVMAQRGRIHVIENGQLRAEPFLDITSRVGSSGNEQGLLGLALHPQYKQNGFFYVNYTDLEGNTVIARFSADPVSAAASADSEKVLLRADQPYANHNGGGLAFGPDGYLYIGLGDGGSGGDPENRARNRNTLLGKLLRIDVDGGDPYAVPAENPYAQGGGGAEIWALGLRNPWRFSFDALTGDLYIGDVGQNLWEEIDFLPAGAAGGTNFGWDYREGTHEYEGQPPDGVTVVDPIYQYPHPEGCSVTGGYVYRGQALPEFNGIYLFSDFCTGKIWGLFRGADGQWQNQVLFESGLSPASFGVDDANELYLLDHQNGAVLMLVKK